MSQTADGNQHCASAGARSTGHDFDDETKECEDCEGSGESDHVWHDGTQYSTKEPPCSTCGGSGKAASI